MQKKQVSNEPSTYVAILPHLRLSIARSSCKGNITLPMLTTDLIVTRSVRDFLSPKNTSEIRSCLLAKSNM